MYARRAAVLCNGECTPRDGFSYAQKEGRRAWWCCLPRPTWSARCVRRACREGPIRPLEGESRGPSYFKPISVVHTLTHSLYYASMIN